MHISERSIQELIHEPYPCRCGKTHSTNVKNILIEQGSLTHLPSLLKESGYQKPFLVADHQTMQACGNLVQEILTQANISHIFFELPMNEIMPDEEHVGSILMAFDRSCDLIIAIGSGTINDLSRFVSYRLGMPYWVIATAPSMDGYVSNVAAMTTNRMKTTYPAQVPECVLGNLDILSNAPYPMLTAGFGDIMGKFTCIMDWQLSHRINGEYYCEDIASIIIRARQLTLDSKEGLRERKPESIHYLINALLLSGIGMSFAGNSRPASGSEHHLSHFWEMRYLFEGRKPILHGTKVAIGTVTSLKLYELLTAWMERQMDKIGAANTLMASHLTCAVGGSHPVLDSSHIVGVDAGSQPVLASSHITGVDAGTDRAPAVPFADDSYTFDEPHWEEEIRRVYLNAAPEVIHLEHTCHKNAKEKRDLRVAAFYRNWCELHNLCKQLPSANDMVDILKSIGAPFRPSEIGLSRELVYDGICYAKEVRDRYTILQLLWDLNLIQDFAQETTEYLFSL